jgi:predicted acylesterase/phospholipase RssA
VQQHDARLALRGLRGKGHGDVTKRWLILAGGGLKVAYQAGVLQVWLDEAGITFDGADGASGGVFNLAMYCQGLTGKEIADNWRDFPVLSSISLNLRQCLRLFWAESILSYNKFRRVVLRDRWKLNWQKINASHRVGTFNAYDFTHHRLVARTQKEVDEDFLIAGVSLPGWFSPVRIHEALFIDAVYVTDANVINAIVNKGADELWIIWTVNRTGVWKAGLINTYFQIIEASANGNLYRDLARIRANNDAFARGGRCEFGRRIKVKMLIGEVQLHYLLNFRRRKFTTAVEQGVADAREWCRNEGHAFNVPRLWDVQRNIPKALPAPVPIAYQPIITEGRYSPRITPVAAHNELTIEASPEHVWETLVRAGDWPSWYPNSRNVRIKRGGSDLSLGATFTWVTFNICLRSVVKEFCPPHRIAWNAKSVGVDAYHAWVIERDGQGSRVKTEETQYGLLARAANWLNPDRIHGAHRLWLRKLATQVSKTKVDNSGSGVAPTMLGDER